MNTHTVIHSDTEQYLTDEQVVLLLELDWIEPIERTCEITDANIETEDDCTTHGHEQVYQVSPVGLAVSPTGDVDELLSTAETDFPDVAAAVALTLRAEPYRNSRPEPTDTPEGVVVATILSIFPDAEVDLDSDGQFVINSGLFALGGLDTLRGPFIKPQPSLGPTPEGHLRLMVLDDGETYSGLAGCSIVEAPLDFLADTDPAFVLGDPEPGEDPKVAFVASFDGDGLQV